MSSTPRTLPHPELADVELTTVLFALSDPARLALVQQLAEEGPQTVAQCHMLDPDVPKSTFSHHLKTLREAGPHPQRAEPVGSARSRLRRAETDARFPGLLDSVV